MKAKTNRIITLAATGLTVLAIMTAATIAANANGNYIDLFLGRGTKHQEESQYDANYIDFKFSKQGSYDDELEKNDTALGYAQKLTREVAEEGMTLLKNDDNALPLAANAKVTVLGYYAWHNNMSGGEDPNGATAGNYTKAAISLAEGIKAGFGEENYNQDVENLYNNAGGDFEHPATSLASAQGTFANYPTAIVVLKRNSGEGSDQTKVGKADVQNRSGLVITTPELELIDYACKSGFEKVIVVVNSANAMELGWLQADDPNMNNGKYRDPYTNTEYDFSKVKGAIWAGCCGSQGGRALANILKGSVNPSGHLVDTYVRDLREDPTYQNFGSYCYDNSDELNSYQDETFFVDYEEGIYVGYRYYETAAYEASKGNYQGFDYKRQVVFPFGYGLSYTTFSQEFVGEPSFNAQTNEYTFQVKVKNTGNVPGKSVAQIYVNTPYIRGGVEKAHVVLGGFAKTKLLNAGAEETLSIVINRDYYTSYDYKTEKCYVLDEGDYKFYLSNNAHSWEDIEANREGLEKATHLRTVNVDHRLVYKDGQAGKRVTDLVTAVNKEDDELNYQFVDYGGQVEHGEGKCINFTRTNFRDSFPQAPFDDDYILSDARALKEVATFDVWDDSRNPVKEMPKYNTDETSYVLSDMRGVDWNDPKWEDYINQFDIESMAYMFGNGGWKEQADEDNGVPESYDADSPYGYYAGALSIKNVNKWYCGDPMVAATFNVELAHELGYAFAEEAHCNSLAGGTLITGIYGFGLNMHRSAFGGRNYEYYSEDGVLAGKMAAAQSSAASERGLICFMKHYCLNDQETNRQKNGYCAWVNEQAFREVYLKGWELYIKESKMNVKYYGDNAAGTGLELKTKEMSGATGIMTCYNRIGATYGGASVSLNGILRDEFGYHGTSITDAGGEPNTYMTTDYLIRRGGHLTLSSNGNGSLYDTTSPTAVASLKDAVKHILFNKANSNCMQGIAPGVKVWYDISPWRVGLGVAWGVIGAALAADAVFITLIALNKIKVKEKEIDPNSDEY